MIEWGELTRDDTLAIAERLGGAEFLQCLIEDYVELQSIDIENKPLSFLTEFITQVEDVAEELAQENAICTACGGSGGGVDDALRCSTCGGSGLRR